MPSAPSGLIFFIALCQCHSFQTNFAWGLITLTGDRHGGLTGQLRSGEDASTFRMGPKSCGANLTENYEDLLLSGQGLETSFSKKGSGDPRAQTLTNTSCRLCKRLLKAFVLHHKNISAAVVAELSTGCFAQVVSACKQKLAHNTWQTPIKNINVYAVGKRWSKV